MNHLDRQVRILHVVASMHRGGMETFLMNVMRRIDREKYRFHFCLTKDKPAEYDDEIRDLGGELIPCALNGGLWAYTRRLGAVLRDGRYDVVHSHMYTFSGVVLRVARKHGVAHRYAHLHTSADDQRNTVARKVYRRAMRWLVRRHGTRVLACAGWVMTNFVGEGWQGDPTRTVVYYGINLDPFAAPADPDGVRAEFGLASGCPLLIHVGRFITAKNHRKLIDVFRAMHAQRPEARLMLVGDGELMDDTRAQVRDYGLDEYIHFTGVRSDVARLMKAADVLVMPSVREGMPVTMLEGTAAGLPVVISDMPGMREANDVCCDGTLLPMDAPVERWVEALASTLNSPKPDQAEALALVRNSPFADDAAARVLEGIYDECTQPSQV